MDYVKLIKNSSRYQGAMEKVADPKAYIEAIQKAGNLNVLKDKSKTPLHSPFKTEECIENRILEAHREYPYWGARKSRHLLINECAMAHYPSVSTFARILKRNNCDVIKNYKSKPAMTRFERSTSNDLWQIKFKGSFMTDLHRCYPLTIIDDFSRYYIGLTACKNERCDTVKDALIACFEIFGLPNQINADNGGGGGGKLVRRFFCKLVPAEYFAL
jgi:transposase InsO family protein